MFYLPKNWIVNKKNEDDVREILKFLNQDIVTEEIQKEKDKKLHRLKDIGENIIYEKIKNNELQFGP